MGTRRDGLALGSAQSRLCILVLSACRRIDLLLVDDPLAEGDDRAWSWPLAGSHFRADDPGDLIPPGIGRMPPEITYDVSACTMTLVLGTLDERKRLPLILDAWEGLCEAEGLELVIAGCVRQPVHDLMTTHNALRCSNVTVIDRYVSNDEASALMESCTAALVLYDSKASSGILLAAAARGRWVIALRESREYRVSRLHDFGIGTNGSAADLARCIASVSNRKLPRRIPIPTSRDFGERTLRSLTSVRDA